MIVRIALFALAVSLVSATGAHAGKPLVSGPVFVGVGDTVTCVLMNVGTKDLSDIQISVFRGETGASEFGTSCSTETPTGVCGAQTDATTGGYRYCAATLSGSTKAVRGKLCNDDSGECSEMR